MAIFLKAKWENLIMVNYQVPSSILEPYLPAGLELDLFENKAYLSLVGFIFKDTRLFNIPIPILGTFEEINLRFYVKRVEGNTTKRGVVFVNETVPYQLVAWLANKLYHESYTALKTKHHVIHDEENKKINYQWQVAKKWNSIQIQSELKASTIENNSIEEFIFEHYFGYAKLNSEVTEEYQIHHPKWQINTVKAYDIQCDFKAMYGKDFEILNELKPQSVLLAEGSPVAINWKRYKLN